MNGNEVPRFTAFAPEVFFRRIIDRKTHRSVTNERLLAREREPCPGVRSGGAKGKAKPAE